MKDKQISINLKIGICDDDICMASDIEKFVMTYCKMKSLGFDIDTYYSGDRIIKDLEERVYFDILFLDIEMKKMDGVMVGHYIREQLHNDSMLIIYIYIFLYTVCNGIVSNSSDGFFGQTHISPKDV